MVKIEHIQYPVGQGGLHLGIIGDYAYIYDCGGYGENVNWENIFKDITVKLSGCKELHIFISHLHTDHYKYTAQLITAIYDTIQKIDICMPPMNPIEKIMLICEHHIGNTDYSDEKLDYEYIDFVRTGKFADVKESGKVRYVNVPNDSIILDKDIILRSYTTNISSENQTKFRNKLLEQHINPDNLIGEILKNDSKFWHGVIEAFKSTFKTKGITNHIMLSLYCGTSRPICRREKINWLHTGDAHMKTYRQLDGFIKAFGKLLSNVNFAQIPHHGSQKNHDSKFFHLFNCCCQFYYTTQDKTGFNGIVKPRIDDSCLTPCQQILQISADPSSKIEF